MSPRAASVANRAGTTAIFGLVFLALVGGGRVATAQLAARAKLERETATAEIVKVDLTDRGFTRGVELRGVFDERVLHLPTLAAARPERGRLRLFLEAQLPGWQRATLEVRIDERSVLARDLLREPSGEVVVPLEPEELRRPHLRVELGLRGSLADDRCVDERAAAGFVRIAARSGLELVLDRGRVEDVWRVWESLPQRVEIAVDPSGDRAETLHTALLTGSALARSGRRVHYRDLVEPAGALVAGLADLVPVRSSARPEALRSSEERIGETTLPRVVIGEPAAVRSRLERLAAALARPEPEPPLPADHGGEIGILRIGRLPILFVRPAAGPALDRLIGSELTPLAAGAESGLRSFEADPAEIGEILPLARLGAELGTRRLRERTVWQFDLPLLRLPPRRVPAELVLDLSVPPPRDEPPILAAVRIDRELLHAAPLPAGPGPHRLRLSLSNRPVRLASTVEVELVRETPTRPCTAWPVGVPVQLLASSHLVSAPAPEPPASFAELAALLDARTPLLIDREAADHPAASLATLTEIGRHLLRPGAPGSLRVVDPEEPLSVEGPFVLVGGGTRPELVAPLRFDRGRVRLIGRSGSPLLEVEPGGELAVAQLARLDGRPGLWLTGTAVGPPPWPGDRLDREDLVIGDRYGTRLALRTEVDRAITVDYPDAISWVDRLAPWRWSLVLAFWSALTLLLVTILRRRQAEPKAGAGSGEA